MKGHQTAKSQQEGAEETGRDSLQEDQADATEGKDIAEVPHCRQAGSNE